MTLSVLRLLAVLGPWHSALLDCAPSSAWFALLLDSSLKSVFLFLAATLLARALRRSSAATRHVVWCLALAGAVAVPMLSRVLPPLHFSWWPLLPVGQAFLPAFREAPAVRETARFEWPGLVFLVWLLGALFLTARMLRSYLLLMKILREAAPAGCERCLSSLRETAAVVAVPQGGSAGLDVAARLGCRRLPALLVSPRIEAPLACGFLKPAILLPPDFAEWSEERRRAVLLHELAHVHRLDPLLGLAARAVAILHWFNPLVWMAARALREESERACDDYVLARGVKPSDYARDLLDLGWTLGLSESPPLAVALARRAQLRGRVMAILDAGAARQPLTRRRSLLAVLAAALFLAPLAALEGPEVARQIPGRLLERNIARPVAFPVRPASRPAFRAAPKRRPSREAAGGATLLLASYELVDAAPARPSFVAVEEFESGRHALVFVMLEPARLLVITWIADDGPRKQPPAFRPAALRTT